jgi:hypothetical protein
MNYSTVPILGKPPTKANPGIRGATRVGCPKPKCKGVAFSMNDGAARLAEHFGRGNYKCDSCGSRWSVQIPGSVSPSRP